jgi:hypothetical protein
MRTAAAIGFVAFVAGAPPSLFVSLAVAQSVPRAPAVQTAPPPAGDVISNCDVYAGQQSDPKRKGKGVPFEQINPTLAVPACIDAVRQHPNDPRLSFQLGRAYLKAKDFDSALEQYLKAAGQNYAPAQYDLGVMYANGEGVAKDDAFLRRFGFGAMHRNVYWAPRTMTIFSSDRSLARRDGDFGS